VQIKEHLTAINPQGEGPEMRHALVIWVYL